MRLPWMSGEIGKERVLTGKAGCSMFFKNSIGNFQELCGQLSATFGN